MDTTPNLNLPYILAAQAQKHVTHNEAVRALDALVQLSVFDKDLATPPASPADGARYIVGASPTGAWAGQAGKIAAFQDSAWAFLDPLEGWLTWVADEDKIYAFDGGAWVLYASGGGSVNPTPLVGVNATADTTNRLSVSSPASLFNHEGAGHQVKVNKNAAGDTASFLFQTNFSGRAEMGTTGDDDFHFKVSPDGSTWKDALQIDKTTGVVTMPFTPGGGSGEANTASNVNVGGVGLFKQKTGVNLEFRGINAASSKVSVALDAANNEVDLDVTEANLTLSNLGGSIDLGGAKASGTLAAARFPALTGDVTSTAGALGTTIANNAVSNAKLADVATATIKGRSTAGTGDPEDLTPAQVRTLINVADGANNYVHPNHSGDVTSVGDGATTIANNVVSNAKLADVPTATFKGRTTAGTGDPEDLTVAQAKTLLNLTGNNSGDQTITLTQDVTGSGTGSFATTIAADAVSNTKLANMAANTIKGNNTGATADPADLTAAQVKTLLAIAAADVSGLGALATLNSVTNAQITDLTITTADIADDQVTNAKLANVATSTIKGRVTAATGDPEDLTPAQVRTLINVADGANNYVHPNHSGDVTSVGDGATTIANNAVSNAKLADVATATIKGRTTAGTGDPEDLTATQATALLNALVGDSGSGGTKGLAPAPAAGDATAGSSCMPTARGPCRLARVAARPIRRPTSTSPASASSSRRLVSIWSSGGSTRDRPRSLSPATRPTTRSTSTWPRPISHLATSAAPSISAARRLPARLLLPVSRLSRATRRRRPGRLQPRSPTMRFRTPSWPTWRRPPSKGGRRPARAIPRI